MRLPENVHLPFGKLTALSKVAGLRYPHPSSLRRTSLYASFLGISEALHMDIFHQPLASLFFESLYELFRDIKFDNIEKGIGMKAFKQTVALLTVYIALIGLVGCGISKEEHEKVLSQVEMANAQLAKTRAELEQANKKIAKMEASQPEEQNKLRIDLKKQRRARQLLRASLADSQRETTILRQQLDELTQSLMKVSRELDVTRQANEVLKRQIDALMEEKGRSQELTEKRR
jgi:hypothetical protein